jgi:hypothetical protein
MGSGFCDYSFCVILWRSRFKVYKICMLRYRCGRGIQSVIDSTFSQRPKLQSQRSSNHETFQLNCVTVSLTSSYLIHILPV